VAAAESGTVSIFFLWHLYLCWLLHVASPAWWSLGSQTSHQSAQPPKVPGILREKCKKKPCCLVESVSDVTCYWLRP
jgi:hypothetical protein